MKAVKNDYLLYMKKQNFMLNIFTTLYPPFCDARYDFRINTIFGLSLPPVICMRAHVLLGLFVFVRFVFTSSCLYEGSCLVGVICVC